MPALIAVCGKRTNIRGCAPEQLWSSSTSGAEREQRCSKTRSVEPSHITDIESLPEHHQRKSWSHSKTQPWDHFQTHGPLRNGFWRAEGKEKT